MEAREGASLVLYNERNLRWTAEGDFVSCMKRTHFAFWASVNGFILILATHFPFKMCGNKCFLVHKITQMLAPEVKHLSLSNKNKIPFVSDDVQQNERRAELINWLNFP